MEASSSPSPSGPTSVPAGSAERRPGTRLERTAAGSLRALRETHPEISAGQFHLVGISGGRDSVALLHFLVSQGFTRLVACHLDHALRGTESDEDAAHVRALAQSLGLPFEFARVDVRQLAATTKTSLETAGRQARQEFFHAMALKHGCRTVFLAHHADDDAETILHHLFRGASLHGIGGISPAAITPGGLLMVRPLLDVTRAEIDAYVKVHGLTFREDSSNQSRLPTRNRIRHELIPLLRDIFRRDVTPSLRRFARLARRDDVMLDSLSTDLARHQELLLPDGALRITPAFQAAPDPVKSRILRDWLRKVQKVPHVGHKEIEAALGLLEHSGPAKVNLPGGGFLRRKARRLFVEKES